MNLRNSSIGRPRCVALSFAAAALFCGVVVPAKAFEFNTVMVSGRPDGDPLGPELGSGIDFSFFEPYSVNNLGQVAFTADLTGDSVTSDDDRGLWRWISGMKELLGREDSQAPGLAAGILVEEFSGSFEPQIIDDGSVVRRANLKGAGVSGGNEIAWLRFDGPGVGTKILRTGDMAPGVSALMTSFSTASDTPARDSTRHVMFLTILAGPGITAANDQAILFGTEDNFSILAREGDPAPGLGAEIIYSSAGVNQFEMTFSGNFTAHIADVDGPGVSTDNDDVLYVGAPGALTVLARESEPMPDGVGNYTAIRGLRMNSSGKTLFNSNGAILLGSATEGVEVLARGGAPAPGTSATFSAFSTDSTLTFASITNSGNVAFLGGLSGAGVDSSNDEGIWVYDGSSVHSTLREGDPAGSLPGVTIGSIDEFAFNDQRMLVVETELVGVDVIADVNDRALWLVNPQGELSLLVRSGDLFDVDPGAAGDLRTIDGSDFSLSLGGARVFHTDAAKTGTFSDTGFLAFGMQFTDGSNGIFITRVPEPASWVIVLFATVAAIGNRWRLRA